MVPPFNALKPGLYGLGIAVAQRRVAGDKERTWCVGAIRPSFIQNSRINQRAFNRSNVFTVIC